MEKSYKIPPWGYGFIGGNNDGIEKDNGWIKPIEGDGIGGDNGDIHGGGSGG